LQEEFFLRAQVLVVSPNSMPFPQHYLLAHKLFCSLIFKHLGEYFQVICIMAPFFPIATSTNTTSTIIALHPKLDGFFLFFLKYYKPN
jgi:hypothetical protein